MAYIFQDIAKKAASAGITPNDTATARDWFRNAAQGITSVSARRLVMGDRKNVVGGLTIESIGRMYMFFYDPKTKDKLPYYDNFPLIFPINFYSDGFLGINLHYLPPYARAQLMNALYETANNDKYDASTKLQISYRILNSSASFSGFKVCVKRYLHQHVQSLFLYVEPKNWDTALMLPTERFVKASKQDVFKEAF